MQTRIPCACYSGQPCISILSLIFSISQFHRKRILFSSDWIFLISQFHIKRILFSSGCAPADFRGQIHCEQSLYWAGSYLCPYRERYSPCSSFFRSVSSFYCLFLTNDPSLFAFNELLMACTKWRAKPVIRRGKQFLKFTKWNLCLICYAVRVGGRRQFRGWNNDRVVERNIWLWKKYYLAIYDESQVIG